MREFILNYGKYITYGLAAFDLLMTLAILATGRKETKSLALIMGIVGLGLVYDCVVVAIGSLLKGSDLLVILSKGRYILHGIMVPLMFPISLYALQPTKQGKIMTWIITLFLLGGGIAAGIFTQLESVEIAGLFRYTASSATPKWASILDRIMTVGGVIILIGAGVIVLKQQKNIALLLSGVFMLVFSALAPITGNLDLNFLIGMVGEALMLLFFMLHVKTVKIEQ
ncbi:MAG: hypothetical protein IJ115_05740 [Erysipelotrichaceae bacterium]|nr:hypothetical protein [Erysipelotrichaceae bacterium]